MKKILVISSLFLLTGCSQTAVTLLTPEYKIIKAPDEMYNCKVEKYFPNPDTLTEKQVGRLILKLQNNNLSCKNNMDALHKFYDDAEATINNKK